MSYPFRTERDKSATNALSFIKPRRDLVSTCLCPGEKKGLSEKNQYLTTVFGGEGGKRGFLDFPTGR